MASRSLNILCFGDSLTSGFCHFGMDSHPYSIRLEDRLAAAFPGSRIEVFTNGVPGDVVSKKPFKNRLQAECTLNPAAILITMITDKLTWRPVEKRQYDWVIMLGGTKYAAPNKFKVTGN